MSGRGKKAGKKAGSRPSTSQALSSIPTLTPKTPEEHRVLLTEGDPVEIEVTCRSYVSKVRAKEANSYVREENSSPFPCRKSVRPSEASTGIPRPASQWLMSRSEAGQPRRSDETSSPDIASKLIDSYRKSATEEEILNFVSSVKPIAKLTNFSPPHASNSSHFSSPDRHRTPIRDLDRVLFLENKLKKSSEKCKMMEKKYKDLLVKHVRSESQGSPEYESSPEGRERALAEESTGLDVEGSVEMLLKKVLEEMRDLKARMTRIENSTGRIEALCGRESQK